MLSENNIAYLFPQSLQHIQKEILGMFSMENTFSILPIGYGLCFLAAIKKHLHTGLIESALAKRSLIPTDVNFQLYLSRKFLDIRDF